MGMADALEADRRKKEVNDAKLRAVAQHVDYDQFCNLVAGAHLKPVKPVDKNSGREEFNYFVMPKEKATGVGAAGGTRQPNAAPAPTLKVPKTGLEFHRMWRRQCRTSEARRAYLELVDTKLLPMIFQSEFEPDILDGVVQTLEAVVDPQTLDARLTAAVVPESDGARDALADDLLLAASWLSMLPEVNRFELALEFASEQTRASLAALAVALRDKRCAKLGHSSERLAAEMRELLRPRALADCFGRFGVEAAD